MFATNSMTSMSSINDTSNYRPHSVASGATNAAPSTSEDNFIMSVSNFPIPPCSLVVNQAKHFYGRKAVYAQIEQAFQKNNMVCLVGESCRGKTSLIYNLANYSEFSCVDSGENINENQVATGLSANSELNSSKSGSFSLENNSISPVRNLNNTIFAVQYCQLDWDQTCRVPDVIFSLANQIHKQLSKRSDLKPGKMVTLKACIQDARRVFTKHIIDPINQYFGENARGENSNSNSNLSSNSSQNTSESSKDYALLIIDDLSASNYHRSSSNTSLHLIQLLSTLEIPSCIKLLLTVRTEHRSLLQPLSNKLVQIELYPTNDELDYVKKRLKEISTTRRLFSQINMGQTVYNTEKQADKQQNKMDALINELSKWLTKTSKGDFLYLALVLELLENGCLRLKSNSFKTLIPSNRWQVISLMFKQKTMVTTMFSPLMHDMLAVILASLRPVTEDGLYRTLAILDTLPYKDGKCIHAEKTSNEYSHQYDENSLLNSSKSGRPTKASKTSSITRANNLTNLKSCPKLLTQNSSSNQLTVADFKRSLGRLNGLLTISNPSESNGYKNLQFSHIAIREWLEKQLQTNLKSQFCVDVRCGHFVLACAKGLCADQRNCFQMAHHMLKSGLIRTKRVKNANSMNSENRMTKTPSNTNPVTRPKSVTKSSSSSKNSPKSDMFFNSIQSSIYAENLVQQLWSYFTQIDLTQSLSDLRNTFYPNIHVSQVLLNFGASPETNTDVLYSAPLICLTSYIGCLEMLKLLTFYGASCEESAKNGMNCLAFSASAGHKAVIEYLIEYLDNDTVCSLLLQKDGNGQIPVLHAALRKHSDVVNCMLASLSKFLENQDKLYQNIVHQVVIAFCSVGDVDALKVIKTSLKTCFKKEKNTDKSKSEKKSLENQPNVKKCVYTFRDSLLGETPLTMAALQNNTNIIEYILGELGSGKSAVEKAIELLNATNSGFYTPCGCAAKTGNSDALRLMLQHDPSLRVGNWKTGFSILNLASASGNLECVEVVLDICMENVVAKGGLPDDLDDCPSLDETEENDSTNHLKNSVIKAAINGHVEILEKLITYGLDFHSVIHHLNKSVIPDKTQKIIQLLSRYSDILNFNEKAPLTRLTPLESAINANNVTLVRTLLQETDALQTEVAWQLAGNNQDPAIAISMLAQTLNKANNFYTAGKIQSADKLYKNALDCLNLLEKDGKSDGESTKQADIGFQRSKSVDKFKNSGEHDLKRDKNRVIVSKQHQELFQVRYKLMMAIIRCRRRLGDLDYAESLCTELISITPEQYEAYYQRARVRRDLGFRSAALEDVEMAKKFGNTNANRVQLQKLYESCYSLEDDVRVGELGGVKSYRPVPVPRSRKSNNLVISDDSGNGNALSNVSTTFE